LESLGSLLKSTLQVSLVLSIANVQDFDEPKALELLKKILPDWSNPELHEAFRVGPNLVTIWTKPAS